MGLTQSKESSVLPAWKTILDIAGTDLVSEWDLCELLQWAEEHGFPTDPHTAFSLDTWQKLRDTLVYELA